jgi:uncharacterized protein
VGELQFEWNPLKDRLNQRKHGVSFREAATVFDGPVLREYDLEHGPEDREIVIGYSYKERLLFVVIYEYEQDTIRIISARRATQAEALRYFAES